jgi:glycosyltransferase 2 family protein
LNTADTNVFPEDNDQLESIEKKQSDLLQEQLHPEKEPEITREQLSLGKRLLNWRTILPLVIVIALLIYVAQKTNIDPQQTWATIRSANLVFFLAAFLVYYLSFPIRALRWRLLLGNVGFNKANGIQLPHFLKLVEIIYISFFANVVVPARLGEIYRAYLLRQETGLSATRTFGTVLAERLLDLIVLVLLMITAIMISFHEKLPPQLLFGLKVTIALVAAGVIGLFALRLLRERVAQLIPPHFRDRYNHFQEGTLGSFRRMPSLTGLTVAVWACESLRFYFIALALGLISGSPLHVIAAACFIGLGEALLTIIPFTAGGVGLVEAGMAAMILLFNPGIPNATNLSVAAVALDRTISLLSIWAFGFIIFMIAFGRQATKQPKKS